MKFIYESIAEKDPGVKRYATYKLGNKAIKSIIKLVKGSLESVGTVSILMGADISKAGRAFQPILRVQLIKNAKSIKFYYFLLEAVLPEEQSAKNTYQYSFVRRNALAVARDSDEQISPIVAELFMLKWHTLNAEELVTSFEGVAPTMVIGDESANPIGSDTTISINVGVQKSERVTKYNFIVAESKAILGKLMEGNSDDIKLFVHLGAGLEVANFHPFNFRPIIEIIDNFVSTSKKLGDAQVGDSSFFDTSKPCPPFCRP